jgi:hypothetical protein
MTEIVIVILCTLLIPTHLFVFSRLLIIKSDEVFASVCSTLGTALAYWSSWLKVIILFQKNGLLQNVLC